MIFWSFVEIRVIYVSSGSFLRILFIKQIHILWIHRNVIDDFTFIHLKHFLWSLSLVELNCDSLKLNIYHWGGDIRKVQVVFIEVELVIFYSILKNTRNVEIYISFLCHGDVYYSRYYKSRFSYFIWFVFLDYI